MSRNDDLDIIEAAFDDKERVTPPRPTTEEGPIRRLEAALKDRATTDGEIVTLMNLLADALHEARGQAAPVPTLDVEAFLDSLRSPRNSLGILALPKGPMAWAVEEAWVPPAVEELDDTGDGVMIHRLSELADLIVDRLQARLATRPVEEEPK